MSCPRWGPVSRAPAPPHGAVSWEPEPAGCEDPAAREGKAAPTSQHIHLLDSLQKNNIRWDCFYNSWEYSIYFKHKKTIEKSICSLIIICSVVQFFTQGNFFLKSSTFEKEIIRFWNFLKQNQFNFDTRKVSILLVISILFREQKKHVSLHHYQRPFILIKKYIKCSNVLEFGSFILTFRDKIVIYSSHSGEIGS